MYKICNWLWPWLLYTMVYKRFLQNEKIYGACQKTSRTGVTKNYLESKIQTQVFPFKVISLESNAFSHLSLWQRNMGKGIACIAKHALLEGFFQEPAQLLRHGLFDVVYVFKMGPLELREEEITRRSQVGWVGRLLQHGDVFLGQKLMNAQCIVSKYVMVKHLRVVLPQLSPLLARWETQYLFVNVLVDFLFLWQELAVEDHLYIIECIQHDCDFELRLSGFLLLWWRWILSLKVLAFGFRESSIYDSSSLMSLPRKSGLVWRRSNMFWHTWLHASIFLIIFHHFWQHLYAKFSQI